MMNSEADPSGVMALAGGATLCPVSPSEENRFHYDSSGKNQFKSNEKAGSFKSAFTQFQHEEEDEDLLNKMYLDVVTEDYRSMILR